MMCVFCLPGSVIRSGSWFWGLGPGQKGSGQRRCSDTRTAEGSWPGASPVVPVQRPRQQPGKQQFHRSTAKLGNIRTSTFLLIQLGLKAFGTKQHAAAVAVQPYVFRASPSAVRKSTAAFTRLRMRSVSFVCRRVRAAARAFPDPEPARPATRRPLPASGPAAQPPVATASSTRFGPAGPTAHEHVRAGGVSDFGWCETLCPQHRAGPSGWQYASAAAGGAQGPETKDTSGFQGRTSSHHQFC